MVRSLITPFVLVLLFVANISCTEKSDPIVIPPGDLISYSNSGFVEISGEYYSLFLQSLRDGTNDAFDIQELQPEGTRSAPFTQKFLIPKTIGNAGVYVIRVRLVKEAIEFISLAIPGEVAKPDYATTLVANLLIQHPSLVAKHDASAVLKSTKWVRAEINKLDSQITFGPEFQVSDRYRYYENYLATNQEFLDLIDDLFDITFELDSDLRPVSMPYPFGRLNRPPALDLTSSTDNKTAVFAPEKVETKIKGIGRDPDNDLLIYRWTYTGKPASFNPREYAWTPDFQDSRPEPYELKLFISDGSPPLEVTWSVQVTDLNRGPKLTANCAKEVTEWQEWECEISGEDFDGDQVDWRLNDRFAKARASLNGQTTDPVTRLTTVTNQNKVTIRFTPNNSDAKLRAAYLELIAFDDKGGQTNLPFQIGVIDINSPPTIVPDSFGNLLKPLNFPEDSAREWDQCTDSDPDGGRAFRFVIEVSDPDNLPAAAPRGQTPEDRDGFDKPTFSGSLREQVSVITEAQGCPASSGTTSYTCFEWRASDLRKSGLLNVILKDDHGGSSPPIELTLTASDRNQRPCLQMPVYNVLLQESRLLEQFNAYASDADNAATPPFLELVQYGAPYETVDFPSEVIPFLRRCSGEHLIFKKTFAENSVRFRTLSPAGSNQSAMCLQAKYYSGVSGVVTLQRASPHTTDIVIPTGTEIRATQGFPVSRLVRFKTSQEVTIEKDVELVNIPVSSIARKANMNAIVRITSASPPAGVSVTNLAPLAESGKVRFTRASTTGTFTIPVGTEVGTDELTGESTIRFVTTSTTTFAAGEGVKDITVARVKQFVTSADTLAWAGAPPAGPAFTLTPSTGSIGEAADYTLTKYRGRGTKSSPPNQDRFCFYTRALDGTQVAANQVNQIVGGLASSLSVTNPSPFALSGEVLFSRSDSSIAISIPAGTEVTTLNKTRYKTVATLNLGIGQASGTAMVYRFNHESPLEPVRSGTVVTLRGGLSSVLQVNNPEGIGSQGFVEFRRNSAGPIVNIPSGTVVSAESIDFQTTESAVMGTSATRVNVNVARTSPFSPQVCMGFRDFNYMPSLLGQAQTSVLEGQSITGFLFTATDNPILPSEPLDPDDRFTFTGLSGLTSPTPSGKTPSGPYLFCRTPGTDPNDISVPACQPCLNTSVSLFESAECFFRFKPNMNDIAESYSFNMVLNDNSADPVDGYVNPLGSNKRPVIFVVNVAEINDPPTHTDSSGNSLGTLGNSQTNPIPMGGFLEGTESRYPVYASDADKSTILKTINFSLHNQIWDFHTSSWKPLPAGMVVTTVGALPPPDPVWGSRYLGELRWKPTDNDAKNLAGASGFAVGIRANDGGPSSTIAWYRLTVANINNSPTMTLTSSNGLPVSNNTLTVVANTYMNWQGIYIDDLDFGSVGAPVNFTTKLSPCLDSEVTSCVADSSAWPEELKSYENPYDFNSTVTACRLGGNVDTQLVFPNNYLVQNQGTKLVNGQYVRRYRYGSKWCPQRSHIGFHNAVLYASDNGDKDRLGNAFSPITIATQWNLNVVSKIFFNSPQMDAFNQPYHYMRQTVAATSSTPFRYRLSVNNSYNNNVAWSVSIANATATQWQNKICTSACPASPASATCNVAGQTNRICIIPINGGKTEAELRWIPNIADVSTTDPLSRPVIRVSARDTARNETAIADFPLWIQSPLTEIEYPPTIDSFDPPSATVNMRERDLKTFSVTASDPNSTDVLHYRWFVNGVLKDDFAADFEYRPSATDGFTDGDGSGPLTFGQHRIRVEVTDGNNVASNEWTVNVKNNIPSPVYAYNAGGNSTGFDIWDLIARRFSVSRASIQNLTLTHDHAVPTQVTVGSVIRNLNHYFFTGTYLRAGQPRRFLMNIKIDSGELKNTAIDRRNLTELPWAPGAETERLTGKKTSSTAFKMLLTPQMNFAGPYSSTQTGLQLDSSTNLSSLSSFSAGMSCTGVCAQDLYRGDYQSGSRRSVEVTKSLTHFFFVSDIGNQLIWAVNGTENPVVSLTGSRRIYDVAVNVENNRLYLTVQDLITKSYQLHVYSVLDVDSLSPPTLVANIPVFDGVNVDNRLADLIVVPVQDAVYANLEGSGGLVRLIDDGYGTPTASDLTFIGVNQIGSSFSGDARLGRKIAINTISNVIFGVSKDSTEVFAIDVSQNPDLTFVDSIGVAPSPVGFDSIHAFPNDGLVIAVVKKHPNSNILGRVYWIK